MQLFELYLVVVFIILESGPREWERETETETDREREEREREGIYIASGGLEGAIAGKTKRFQQLRVQGRLTALLSHLLLDPHACPLQ